MRNYTLRHWLVAAAIAVMPLSVDAAGLGKLTILSSLGQPLQAEVELVSVQKEETSTLSARLASPEAYQQANLQYSQALQGVRVSIERRSNGQHYIRITSSRPVNEPFVDLLVELNWAAGKLVREYTALIDPPGYGPVAAPVAPAPAPAVAAPAAPRAAPIERATPPSAATEASGGAGREYGPVKRGDTLSKVASSVKPEGVTLEQMLVGLYRSNPDAFVSNMNRLKTGRILKIPEKEALTATPQTEAVKEVRLQAANWHSYRQKVADVADRTPEARAPATGRITTKVDEKAAGEPDRGVVKLSKGEPPKGDVSGKRAQTPADRVRTLEEEAVAREKALTEARDRIVQLEKMLQDQKKLVDLKSAPMAAQQQVAEKGAAPKSEAKPEAKPAAPAPQAPKAPDAKGDAAKAPDAKAEAPKAPEAKPDADKAATPAPQPPADEKKAAEPAPKPKPKVVPPPPQPDLLESILGEPLYLLGGLGVLLLGGAGAWYARRRRSGVLPAKAKKEIPPSSFDKTMKIEAPAAAAATVAAAGEVAAAQVAAAPAAAAPVSEEVDPLAEAEVYIAYGRDAQAEEILKEAMAASPDRPEVQLKLLEIYSARKDKNAFNALAKQLHGLTGGAGDTWLKVAAMGYALDSGNALYEAGKDVHLPDAGAATPDAGGSTDLDFDLGAPVGTATDITLEPAGAEGVPQETVVLDISAAPEPAAAQSAEAGDVQPLVPDFSLEIPSGDAPAEAAQPDVVLDFELPATEAPAAEPAVAAAPAGDANMMDFNLDLPSAEPEPAPAAAAAPAEPAAADANVMDFNLDLPAAEPSPPPAAVDAVPAAATAGDGGLDFKLDLGDLNLNLDEKPADAAAGGDKDGHWYDVQQKFDLAKAYQEMGDKDGAREILQEVLKEGDDGQKTEAQKLLDALG